MVKGHTTTHHPPPTIHYPPERSDMRRSASALLLGAALAAAGCRGGNCDLVESQLRARETDVHMLRAELDRAHAVNQGMQQELAAAHGDGAGPPPGAAAPGVMAYPVRTLTLGRQTGGHDADDCPGDEALQVVVEPRDADDQVVKAPGSLIVQALEVSPEGVKRPLSSWEVSEDELRRSWRTGLLSTGYTVVLPWKIWPSTEKVRVVVQLRAPDGRLYEADKDVCVRLAPGARRPAAPVGPPPREVPTLPPPKPLDPTPEGPVLDPASLGKPAPADAGPRKADFRVPAFEPYPAVAPAAEILRPTPTPDPKR
jgi:hypothetical protein